MNVFHYVVSSFLAQLAENDHKSEHSSLEDFDSSGISCFTAEWFLFFKCIIFFLYNVDGDVGIPSRSFTGQQKTVGNVIPKTDHPNKIGRIKRLKFIPELWIIQLKH